MPGKLLITIIFISISGSIIYLILGLFVIFDFNYFKLLGDKVNNNSPFKSSKAFLIAEFLGASAINALIAFLNVFFSKDKPNQNINNGDIEIENLDNKIKEEPIETINSVKHTSSEISLKLIDKSDSNEVNEKPISSEGIGSNQQIIEG